MTSEATPTTTTRETTSRKSHNGGDSSMSSRPDVQSAVHEVRGALNDIGRQVPGVARASRDAAGDIYRAIETGTDERVSAGVSLSLGLAIGMLIGGAPRLFILVALFPVAAMGLSIGDRRVRQRTTASKA